METLVLRYCDMPNAVRRPMWRIWHKLLIRFDRDARAVFLNYGYEDGVGAAERPLREEDQANRYGIQLYDKVISRIRLHGRDVVEVGSGRGGGASFLTRYYHPRTYRGIDISSNVIAFCNHYHDVEGLTFIKGCAENLPLDDDSCDVLVNVESARCYRDIRRFFREAKRVLRPGGQFAFADMVPPDHIRELRHRLRESGFRIVEEENITPQVVRALTLDSSRREGIIRRRCPRFLARAFSQFAGVFGSDRYQAFASGRFQYWTFLLEASV